ncbi:MAG: 4-hydroxy-tetrahydrodipicolinate reductase [Luteimonas sp.]
MNTPATPVRLLLHGASGRMGQALLRLAAQGQEMRIAAAVARTVQQRVVDGIPHFSANELAGTPEFDVAVDFSRAGAFDGVLGLCSARAVPLVSGTTGLTSEQEAAMAAAAARIPILWASNFSLGVAVLADLVERAARALPGWDCDIVEAHHVHKQDAPSGTAIALGDAAQRNGAAPRFASIRAGDIVGEHTVQFATDGERIELVHRATNRDIFARGALAAAAWVQGRDPGLYTLRDMLD